MSDFTAGVVVIVFGALIICGLMFIDTVVQKAKCEADLPRNVECVWAAPEEMNDE